MTNKEIKDIWSMNNWVEPWKKAVDSWSTEAQKLQQTTLEGMSRTLDNSHALAKQGLGMAADITATMTNQAKAQIERTVNLVNTFTQK